MLSSAIVDEGIHYLFDTSHVYTIVKITLKQNYIQLSVSQNAQVI